jgi:hypothetical protein
MDRASVTKIDDEDGVFLEKWLLAQVTSDQIFPIESSEYQKLLGHSVRSKAGLVQVSVPEQPTLEALGEGAPTREVSESTRLQSALAKIGSETGFRIWIPKSDRGRVLKEWPDTTSALLEVLSPELRSSSPSTAACPASWSRFPFDRLVDAAGDRVGGRQAGEEPPLETCSNGGVLRGRRVVIAKEV